MPLDSMKLVLNEDLDSLNQDTGHLLNLNERLSQYALFVSNLERTSRDQGVSIENYKAQSAALTRCATQPAYKSGFESFFGAMERMLRQNGPVPLAEYKREVVRTLLPMAPYLQGM